MLTFVQFSEKQGYKQIHNKQTGLVLQLFPKKPSQVSPSVVWFACLNIRG